MSNRIYSVIAAMLLGVFFQTQIEDPSLLFSLCAGFGFACGFFGGMLDERSKAKDDHV